MNGVRLLFEVMGEGAVSIMVRGLCHDYATDAGPLRVIDELDLDVAAGEIVAVTGSSGVGKTTVLSLLGGLDRVQAGSVVVGGADIGGLRRDALAAYRRTTIGFVFQDYGLLPSLTATENVEFALAMAGVSRKRRRARARELLDAVGLTARASHRPYALSGGESQRVAIARALANAPRLVLADEPTGNLDGAASDQVLEMLQRLPREHDCTVVAVTHNLSVASACDRVIELRSNVATTT